MGIVTGVERRRRWRREEKLRIVVEVEQPGASFAAVARRHELSRGLLWNWRARVRSGALAPEPMPVFMPVRITGDMPLLGYPVPTHAAPALPSPRLSPGPAAPAPERIEIALPDGTCIRVGADVGLVALRRVMA
ncbi:MAG: transposase, partial [Microbacteriaceae bacterium]|nr:transposase [Burkholderiaceae bacterium]